MIRFIFVLKLGCTAMVASGIGCATMVSLPTAGEDQAKRPQSQAETCTVVIREDGLPLKKVPYQLTPATTVNQVLEDLKIRHRFGRMEIKILRPHPLPGNPVMGYEKLHVEYDTYRRNVPFESDYALKPGDQLVVIEDESNIIDDLLGRVGM